MSRPVRCSLVEWFDRKLTRAFDGCSVLLGYRGEPGVPVLGADAVGGEEARVGQDC